MTDSYTHSQVSTPPRPSEIGQGGEALELMAPVGSRDSLAAALQAGADSIYFGVTHLNMRAHSANTFTLDDLREIAAICHDASVRAYLTVNTVIYGEDLPLMRQVLDAALEARIDAIIASDVAVMTYARKIGLEVHLSTQLNISNVEALSFYAQFADVVVLARELNLKQVAAIHQAIKEENICGPSGQQVRIEMFCHGALCMAISGKCYLSAHCTGRSANRGECMQICRRRYRLIDDETGQELVAEGRYLLSPKDLKTIDFLPQMVAAGVRVFKVEGRARGPEYVRTVVEAYKGALTGLTPDPSPKERGVYTFEGGKPTATNGDHSPLLGRGAGGEAVGGEAGEAAASLATVFNRGFWDGYYLGSPVPELTPAAGSQATERKVYVGKGTKYYSRLGLGEFHIEAAELHVGDRFLVTGPTTGAVYGVITEMHDDTNQAVPMARQGQNVAFAVDAKVRPSDKLFKIVPASEVV